MTQSPRADKVFVVDENNNDAFGETVDSNGNAPNGNISNGRSSSHGTDYDYKFTIKWNNVIGMILFHVMGFYGIHLISQTGRVWYTVFSSKSLILPKNFSHLSCDTVYLMIMFSGLGVTAGTHRLWSHRSYKATLRLRILLMIMQTSALQNDVIDWCRDHRVHHKYSETDADPHNANRGFFFAHIGWLMAKKHPLVIKRGREADLSDLKADPVLDFQHQYYAYGAVFMAGILPFSIAYFLLGYTAKVSFFTFVVTRLMFLTHGTSLVNSAAHMYGNRPYDKTINPSENLFVSTLAFGEG